jgi:UDP-glucose 4-epimerase
MKIIITGACGHIGSYVTDKINGIKKIKEVILIDNLNSQRYSSLFNLKKNIKFSFYNIDLSRESLNKFKKINLIIHCASLTNAEGSFSVKKEMSPYAEIKLIEEKLLKSNRNKLKYMSFRFGTIAGVSKGMRFHTAINKFCFNASLNQKIHVYKTAYNQYRPYLSLKDAFKVFKFCIEKNIYKNEVYNALSGNFTVKQIIKMIQKYKKRTGIKFVNTAIMNQLSYHVDNKKLKKLGLNLQSDVKNDIKDTLKLFNSLKY